MAMADHAYGELENKQLQGPQPAILELIFNFLSSGGPEQI